MDLRLIARILRTRRRLRSREHWTRAELMDAPCSALHIMDTLRIKNQLLSRCHQLLTRYHDELARANEELDSIEIVDVDKASAQWDVRVLSILGHADTTGLVRASWKLG